MVLRQMCTRFPFGSCWPVTKSIVPSWDLNVVLEAICEPLFEPLDALDLRMLSCRKPCCWYWCQRKALVIIMRCQCIPHASSFHWRGQVCCCLQPRTDLKSCWGSIMHSHLSWPPCQISLVTRMKTIDSMRCALCKFYITLS